MYWSRLIEKTLKDVEKNFSAIVITGPRQSGKSTLLREYLKDKDPTIVNLDSPVERALIEDDPFTFLKEAKKPVILDEIQYMPELAHYIKQFVDDERTPGQWYITGSQQFSVMKNISESLAGRVAVLSLPTFSILEKKVESTLESLIFASSYPELNVNKINNKIWYSSYMQTYLERDVRQILDIGNIRDFEQCLRLLAARTGHILNYSEIARSLGISVPTIKRWISVLEASYVIFLIPPFLNNYGKRIIKSPKIYFYDIGLVNFLIGIENISMVINGPMSGAIFETSIISDLVKQRYAQGIKPDFYYWRSQSGVEIDLIIPSNGKYFPIEIKMSSTIKPAFYRHLKYWRSFEGNQDTTGYLISNCNQSLPLPSYIRNIHWMNININSFFNN